MRIYHQVVGERRRKGKFIIITGYPIQFEEIKGVRGICEQGMKEDLTKVVEGHKAKDFSLKYELPLSTVKRLRNALGITKRRVKKKSSEAEKLEFIKIKKD